MLEAIDQLPLPEQDISMLAGGVIEGDQMAAIQVQSARAVGAPCFDDLLEAPASDELGFAMLLAGASRMGLAAGEAQALFVLDGGLDETMPFYSESD